MIHPGTTPDKTHQDLKESLIHMNRKNGISMTAPHLMTETPQSLQLELPDHWYLVSERRLQRLDDECYVDPDFFKDVRARPHEVNTCGRDALLGFLQWVQHNCVIKETSDGMCYYCLSIDEVSLRITELNAKKEVVCL
jgi:hypothetical protein